MTALMVDPIDHWTDLHVYTPRQALRAEMWQAVDLAVAAPAGQTRAYWIGVFTGYSVAFGLTTREALQNARREPAVQPVNPMQRVTFRDEAHALACGVLYGYSQGISEMDDVADCPNCGVRNHLELDFCSPCVHGTFCDDCTADWHSGLPRAENCLTDES